MTKISTSAPGWGLPALGLALVLGCCAAALAADEPNEGALELARGEPEKDQEEDGLFDREALTGDWAGRRTWLADHGVELGFLYTLDALGVVDGGVHRKMAWFDNFDMTFTLDGEKAFNWPGLRIFIYGYGNNGDVPTENVGGFNPITNLEDVSTWKLSEAWIEQCLLDGRLSLLGGYYYLNGEFDRIETAGTLIGQVFDHQREFGLAGRSGASLFPLVDVAVRLRAKLTENVYLLAAWTEGREAFVLDVPLAGEVNGQPLGNQWAFELGYKQGAEPESKEAYGKYAFAGWFHDGLYDDMIEVQPNGVAAQRRGNWGVNGIAEQVVYREAEDQTQGLAVFGRLGYQEEQFNNFGWYFSSGAVYTGLFPGREEDQLGVGVASTFAGEDYKVAARRAGRPVRTAEVAFELAYRVPVAGWLTVTPDFQYVMNPSATKDLHDAVILGGRIQAAF